MRKTPTLAATLLLALVLAGCGNIGGGETIVQGNDNLMVLDEAIDRVAAALAGFEATPDVTDADLQAVYGKIRERALDGDLDSSLVLLKVAAIQRTPPSD
jgi:hypothetical protein